MTDVNKTPAQPIVDPIEDLDSPYDLSDPSKVRETGFNQDAVKEFGSPLTLSTALPKYANTTKYFPSASVGLEGDLKLPWMVEGFNFKNDKDKAVFVAGLNLPFSINYTRHPGRLPKNGGPNALNLSATPGIRYALPFNEQSLFVAGINIEGALAPAMILDDDGNPTGDYDPNHSYGVTLGGYYYIDREPVDGVARVYLPVISAEIGYGSAGFADGLRLIPNATFRSVGSNDSKLDDKKLTLKFSDPFGIGLDAKYVRTTNKRDVTLEDGSVDRDYYDLSQAFTGTATINFFRGTKLQLEGTYSTKSGTTNSYYHLTSDFAYGRQFDGSLGIKGSDFWVFGKNVEGEGVSKEVVRLNRLYGAEALDQIIPVSLSFNFSLKDYTYWDMVAEDGKPMLDGSQVSNDQQTLPVEQNQGWNLTLNPQLKITLNPGIIPEDAFTLKLNVPFNFTDRREAEVNFFDPAGEESTFALSYEAGLNSIKIERDASTLRQTQGAVSAMDEEVIFYLQSVDTGPKLSAERAHKVWNNRFVPYMIENSLTAYKDLEETVLAEYENTFRDEWGYTFDEFLMVIDWCNAKGKTLKDAKAFAPYFKGYAETRPNVTIESLLFNFDKDEGGNWRDTLDVDFATYTDMVHWSMLKGSNLKALKDEDTRKEFDDTKAWLKENELTMADLLTHLEAGVYFISPEFAAHFASFKAGMSSTLSAEEKQAALEAAWAGQIIPYINAQHLHSYSEIKAEVLDVWTEYSTNLNLSFEDFVALLAYANENKTTLSDLEIETAVMANYANTIDTDTTLKSLIADYAAVKTKYADDFKDSQDNAVSTFDFGTYVDMLAWGMASQQKLADMDVVEYKLVSTWSLRTGDDYTAIVTALTDFANDSGDITAMKLLGFGEEFKLTLADLQGFVEAAKIYLDHTNADGEEIHSDESLDSLMADYEQFYTNGPGIGMSVDDFSKSLFVANQHDVSVEELLSYSGSFIQYIRDNRGGSYTSVHELMSDPLDIMTTNSLDLAGYAIAVEWSVVTGDKLENFDYERFEQANDWVIQNGVIFFSDMLYDFEAMQIVNPGFQDMFDSIMKDSGLSDDDITLAWNEQFVPYMQRTNLKKVSSTKSELFETYNRKFKGWGYDANEFLDVIAWTNVADLRLKEVKQDEFEAARDWAIDKNRTFEDLKAQAEADGLTALQYVQKYLM